MTAYLNGDFLPLAQARISPLDRGFLFGDGVYEVIPVYAGKPFCLPQHLQRLDNSLNGIRLNNPHTHDEWATLIQRLLAENTANSDHVLYLQITRGAPDKRDHNFPSNVAPTVFATCNPLAPVPDSIKAHGVKAITQPDTRWQLNHIKATALLANVLLKDAANAQHANEAILIDNGYLTEGASSNVFIVKNGIVKTPPLAKNILPGITRDFILQLAPTINQPLEQIAISADDLHNADEIWLTSSTREIYPVTQLDDHPVGTGQPGPCWQHCFNAYQHAKHT